MGKKHTEFYEKLGVEPDATSAQLKKAYHKAALRLHPDKPGGDAKAFQEMKDIYDVLRDPSKRKVYDTYGPHMVKIMNGNATPEDLLRAMGSLRKRDRLKILLVFVIIAGVLLSFPILLSLQWDNVANNDADSWSWAETFIPLWILQAVFIIMFVAMVRTDDVAEEASEADKLLHEEVKREVRDLRVKYAVTMVLLILLEVFLVLRLDGTVSWSYMIVLLPWTVLEAFYIGFNIYKAPARFVVEMPGANLPVEGNQNATSLKMLMTLPNFRFYLVYINRWHVLLFITSLLIGAAADEKVDWWEAAIPLLFGYGVSFLVAYKTNLDELAEQDRLQREEERQQHAVEEGNPPSGPMPESRRWFAIPWSWVCGSGPCLMMFCLACAKLETPTQFSAFIIFLPIFVGVGLVCCIYSCIVCVITPDVVDRTEEAITQEHGHSHSGDGARPAITYGTVNETHIQIETEPLKSDQREQNSTSNAKDDDDDATEGETVALA